MYKLIVILALILSACTYSVTPAAFDIGVKWCDPHGGLSLVSREPFNQGAVKVEATCKDGVVVKKLITGVTGV